MANIEGRPLTDVLGELDNGDFLAEITAELYKVVRAVQETRKAGGLKLTIKLSPTGKGSVELDAKFDATIPEHDRNSTTFFVGRDGSLLRNDPAQPRLPFREVVSDGGAPLEVTEVRGAAAGWKD